MIQVRIKQKGNKRYFKVTCMGVVSWYDSLTLAMDAARKAARRFGMRVKVQGS